MLAPKGPTHIALLSACRRSFRFFFPANPFSTSILRSQEILLAFNPLRHRIMNSQPLGYPHVYESAFSQRTRATSSMSTLPAIFCLWCCPTLAAVVPCVPDEEGCCQCCVGRGVRFALTGLIGICCCYSLVRFPPKPGSIWSIHG